MKPVSERTWEHRLLMGSAWLIGLGYALVATGYFMAPQPWSVRLEYWFYRHFPLYHDCQMWGALVVLVLWLAGCLLLVRRGIRESSVPRAGLARAAVAPVLLLLLNAAFFHAAARIAPLSLGR